MRGSAFNYHQRKGVNQQLAREHYLMLANTSNLIWANPAIRRVEQTM